MGGIDELLARWAASVRYVAAFAGDRGRIPGQTTFIEAPADRFVATDLDVAGRTLVVRHIPGHTRGAMAIGLSGGDDVPSDVFTGDTLFAAGCGRLFEGTPAEMFASLQALTALPDDDPPVVRPRVHRQQPALRRPRRAGQSRGRGNAAPLPARTTPTTVALERATNPFVRAGSVEVLAARRAAKDKF